MSEFLAEINWSPLWISLKTGFTATVIAFFLGIFFARLVMKMKPVSRGILDGILTMPLVLPPTVAGFILLLLFSLRRPFGAFLLDNFDIKIVQTYDWEYEGFRSPSDQENPDVLLYGFPLPLPLPAYFP